MDVINLNACLNVIEYVVVKLNLVFERTQISRTFFRLL